MAIEYNEDQISSMAEEFMALQKIEIKLLGDNNITQKTIDKAAGSVLLYTKKEKLEKLLGELDDIIESLVEKGASRGKIMSKKTMDRWLDNQERIIRRQEAIDKINTLNSKRAALRLDVYKAELSKEFGILKNDIDIFVKRATASGLPKKEILKQLVRAAEDKVGFQQAFAKRVKSMESAILRREAISREIDEYRKVAKPGEEWQWITVSAKPCPDCQIRAGVVLPFAEWEARGIPGAGATVCGFHCLCHLYPMSIAEDMFAEVKTFKWDKESGVLTTAGNMRIFGAAKNAPPQNM